MYLTGGQFKGRKINVPKNTKPTLSKVRESVFNILAQYNFVDPTFLDMFAGSAIMGLEALSRGYKVKELEINPKTVHIIKENYARLSLTPDLTICDSIKYVSEICFDIIYIDPPWSLDYIPIINKAIELTNKNSLIIVEYDKIRDINLNMIIKENNFNLEIIKSKTYGRCLIDILRHSAL